MCNKQKAPAATEALIANDLAHDYNSHILAEQELYDYGIPQYCSEFDEYDVESGLRILDDFEVSDLLFLDECYAENGGYYGGY